MSAFEKIMSCRDVGPLLVFFVCDEVSESESKQISAHPGEPEHQGDDDQHGGEREEKRIDLRAVEEAKADPRVAGQDESKGRWNHNQPQPESCPRQSQRLEDQEQRQSRRTKSQSQSGSDWRPRVEGPQ